MSAEEATQDRRRQRLEALIAATRKTDGRILAFDDVLIVIHQALLQQILDASLPIEQVIGARYRIRVPTCRVLFEDGFALVRLEGSAYLVNQPDIGAHLTVYAGLEKAELDARSGVLRGSCRIFAVEARRVEALGMGRAAENLVEELGRQKLEEFSPLLSTIEIPVRLEHRITIPALGPKGGVSIPSAEVPLDMTVADLRSFRQRLWVTVKAAPEGSQGATR